MQAPRSSPTPDSHPYPSRSSRRTPLAIRILRIVVWLSPSIAFVATLLGIWLAGLPQWTLIAAPCLVLAIASGFDAMLSRSTPSHDGKPEFKPLLRYGFRYVAIQIIFAPIVIISMIFAIYWLDEFI